MSHIFDFEPDDDEPEFEHFDLSDERTIALSKRYADLRQVYACVITNIPAVKWRENDEMNVIMLELDFLAGELNLPNSVTLAAIIYDDNSLWKQN